uniref:Major facilitator superfamily (MFS) profile domain-containing protein n=1 Tax=Picea sitchensis TaxID=3332 RepID=B8LKH1_PICSI|nr:unknown [Picea sitchensis]
MTVGAVLSQGPLSHFSLPGYQYNQALAVYGVERHETHQRILLSWSPSLCLSPRRKISAKWNTDLRNFSHGRLEYTSAPAFRNGIGRTSYHVKSRRQSAGKFQFFLSSESGNSNWSKPRNSGKIGVSFIKYRQHSENPDTNDPRIKARADFEPDIGADAPDAVSSFKVLPGSVTVQRVVDRGYLWLKEFPKRWLIVLLCFFAFLLCNMDRVNMSIAILPMSREFNWSPATVGLVQSSFFWGYLLTQVAGGIWADKVGGKRVLGFGVVWWSIATILTPIAARVGLPFLLLVRAFMGIGEGVAMPAMNNILSRWIPAKERSRSLALVYSGMYLGSVAGLAFSPFLIQKFSWPSVFYSFGSLGTIWFATWQRNAQSSPLEDLEIRPEEKEFILRNSELKEPVKTIPWKLLLSKAPVWALIVCHFCHNWGTFILLTWMPTYYNQAQSSPLEDLEIRPEEKEFILRNSELKEPVKTIPWKLLLSKAPVWALIVCHFCHNWGTFILLTWMPTYYNQVLKFNLTESGIFCVLPWLTMALSANLGGWIADTLVSRGVSITTVRKVMQSIGFLGPAFFLTQLSHVRSPAMAVLCMTCSQGCDAFSQSGLYSNHQDIGPRYAGVLLGLSNTAGVLAGVFGTAATGYILQNGSWDDVFKVAVGLYLVGTVVWNLFATGERVFD